jgi:hypothetical protein
MERSQVCAVKLVFASTGLQVIKGQRASSYPVINPPDTHAGSFCDFENYQPFTVQRLYRFIRIHNQTSKPIKKAVNWGREPSFTPVATWIHIICLPKIRT